MGRAPGGSGGAGAWARGAGGGGGGTGRGGRKIDGWPKWVGTFFGYWTKKESVIKADGRGFSAPLNEIHLADNQAELGGVLWNLKPLFLHETYSCHLATNEAKTGLTLSPVVFFE